MNNKTTASAVKTKGLVKTCFAGDRIISILRGIDLNISRGELVSVCGPSGAGKSTLMHILGLIDIPTEGSLEILDKNASSLSTRAKEQLRNTEIGFVFQAHYLMPDFTAMENVLVPVVIGNRNSSTKKTEKIEKARNLLERLGLSERLEHRPSQLSGGECQRVAIARALIQSPSLLLCDEPTGNLDSRTGEAITDLLVRENTENSTTVVIVTHNKELASLAHRMIWIEDGKITENI